MSPAFSLLVLLSILCNNVINSTPSDFDCPSITRQQLQDTGNALNGSPLAILYKCNVTVPTNIPSESKQLTETKKELTETMDYQF